MLPASSPRAASIRSCSAAFDRPGSGHSACGLSITKVSEEFGGIGSVATSAVPVFENTSATCGNRATASSTLSCIACDWVSDVEGIRVALSAMLFSSSVRDELGPEPCGEEARARRAAAAPPRRRAPGARIAAPRTGR